MRTQDQIFNHITEAVTTGEMLFSNRRKLADEIYDKYVPKWVDIEEANLTNGEMYHFSDGKKQLYLKYENGLLYKGGFIVYKFNFEAKKVLIGLPTPPNE